MDSKILHILLVDDDPDLLATMGDIFELKGFAPILVGTGRAALAQFEQQNIDVALIDLKLEDMSGLDLLHSIKTNSPATECILLTGYASQGSAIEAVNAGAYSYFQKPCDLDQLFLSVQRAAEKRASGQKVQRLLEQQLAINQLALALGESLNLNEVYHTIHQHLLSLVDMRSLIISSYDEQAKMIRAEYAQSDRVYDVSGLPPLPLGAPGQGTQSRVIHTGRAISSKLTVPCTRKTPRKKTKRIPRARRFICR
jgi:ActR/RegA family two-component response regulator